MIKVVVINGRPGCGKTTFEHLCEDICGTFTMEPNGNGLGFSENKSLYVDICSTVDFVKRIAKECGWDGTKTLENRRFLSDLKDLLTRWNDIPFKCIKARADFRAESDGIVDWILFVDCREPTEIQKLKERLNATTLLIRRPQVEDNETSNDSDAKVFDYDYDLNIYNEFGVDELKMLAEHFIEYMKKEEVPHYESRND